MLILWFLSWIKAGFVRNAAGAGEDLRKLAKFAQRAKNVKLAKLRYNPLCSQIGAEANHSRKSSKLEFISIDFFIGSFNRARTLGVCKSSSLCPNSTPKCDTRQLSS